jgi:hypothetical protein
MSRPNSYDFPPFWLRIRRSIKILTAICVVIYAVICVVICALHCSVIGRITHSHHVTCVVTTIKQTIFMSCAINVEHASSIVVILINICRSARVPIPRCLHTTVASSSSQLYEQTVDVIPVWPLTDNNRPPVPRYIVFCPAISEIIVYSLSIVFFYLYESYENDIQWEWKLTIKTTNDNFSQNLVVKRFIGIHQILRI